jgi:hypothetical protein
LKSYPEASLSCIYGLSSEPGDSWTEFMDMTSVYLQTTDMSAAQVYQDRILKMNLFSQHLDQMREQMTYKQTPKTPAVRKKPAQLTSKRTKRPKLNKSHSTTHELQDNRATSPGTNAASLSPLRLDERRMEAHSR